MISRIQNPEKFGEELRGALMLAIVYTIANIIDSHGVNIWGHLGGAVGGTLFAFWLSLYIQKKLTSLPSPTKPTDKPS